tara:strand:+ start:1329 stop:1850 length:522 start_codon:yes stop_codon:yes gene_type:complete
MKEFLFAIPIFKIEVNNFKKKKKELINIFSHFPEKKIGLQDFFTNRQSNRKGLSDSFANVCKEELIKLTELIQRNVSIEDVWSTSYKRGNYHPVHNHGSLGLTGILYLDMPKDAPTTEYIQPWNDIVTDTTSYSSVPTEEGTIVIVPSFINHFTKPSKSKKIKRIISWDMKII